ncbi:MAG: hypothetical protein IJP65_00260 [Bacteroidales bacterium]|nr:hypothetical protein [Bacteroidales bacterium]
MSKCEALSGAFKIPALRNIVTAALNEIAEGHNNSSENQCIGSKEYIDCGSWTWQA